MIYSSPPLLAVINYGVRYSSFTYHLLTSVSGPILIHMQAAGDCYGLKAEISPSALRALLLRLRVWMRLIWAGGAVRVDIAPEYLDPPLTGRMRKQGRRWARVSKPVSRRANVLGWYILRARGYAYLVQWLYNHTLTPRVRWCFTAWNWCWAKRRVFQSLTGRAALTGTGRDAPCAAPLSPD